MTDATLKTSLAPGLLLTALVAVGALALGQLEAYLFGRTWVEPLVLAILLGATLRSLWTPPAPLRPGITFAAKSVLEVAVVLLGASISLPALRAAGPGLLFGIAAIVTVVVAASYAIGRALGLPHRMAVLVAAGNSICGNSAIAAVAPVIGATAQDVASSIAFTAVLGVAVVLLLPLAAPLAGLSELQYGILAGLTVYAVPQVLAATVPVGALATQTGTLVKLVRVLMLGPLVLLLSLQAARSGRSAGARIRFAQAVPWFILGFMALAALRATGLLPPQAVALTATLSSALTLLAMAALGLGVDVRTVARAGPAVSATVVLSLAVLVAASLLLLRLLA